MMADGAGDQLYTLSKQREYQSALLEGGSGTVIPFIYPPQFALVYVPFSKLPYRVAYAVGW